jgi:hypothetical protein
MSKKKPEGRDRCICVLLLSLDVRPFFPVFLYT